MRVAKNENGVRGGFKDRELFSAILEATISLKADKKTNLHAMNLGALVGDRAVMSSIIVLDLSG